MFRGAMISLLYNRTMSLQDGACSESAALTLMSTGNEQPPLQHLYVASWRNDL